MAENWWEEAPVAGSPAAASPAGTGENWWEEARVVDSSAAPSTSAAARADLPSRSLGEWASDTWSRGVQTARSVTGGIVGAPVNLANAAATIPRTSYRAQNALRSMLGMDELPSWVTEWADPIAQPDAVTGIRESLSLDNEAAIAAMTPQARAMMQGVEEQDGYLDTLGYYARRPAFAVQEVLAQIPQLLQAVPGSLPGTVAAQMVGIGSQAEQQASEEAAKRGMTPEEQRLAGADAFALTAPVGGLGAVVPGGLALERLIGGQAARIAGPGVAARAGAGGRAFLGETATETVQEGLEQAAQNIALGDPVLKDVGRAAAQGTVLGAGMATPTAAMTAATARPDVAPRAASGVQSPPQQSAASAMMGESDVQAEDQAEGQARREAGPRREAEEGVQEEVTPAAAMAAGVDLSPRVPAPATLTGGETREQILEEIARAGTAEERARSAGRLAAFDAQVRGAEAGSVEADGAAGARAAQAGLQGEDRAPAAQAPEIPDFPGLTPAQREIEARAKDRVTRDPEAALRDYAALPSTDGGRVVNTDEAREIFEDYNSGPEARSANAVAVHEPASWVANETFRRRMAAPVAEGKDAAVFFTGGGTGAGKSTGPKRIAEIGDAERNADTVFDGNLSSERSAVSKIELALNSGREVNILYTFRDPIQAFLHGALPRAERADYGRTVPTKPHTDAHVGAAQTYFALRERYANDPRVRIRALWNDFEPGVTSEIRQASDEEIRAIADADRGTLQQELNNALEQARQAGKVSDRVYYGTRGEPAPQRQERGVDSPGELAGQPAEGQGEAAPRLIPARRSSASRGSEAAAEALGSAHVGIDYMPTPAALPESVRRRLGFTEADMDAEGVYDPDTGRVYVFEDNIRPFGSQTREDRVAWVAAHERSGHAGLRGMFRDQAGSAQEAARAMVAMLDRSGRNDTVRALVAAMEGQREERGLRAVEEALSELAAAVRTGNFTHLQERYGVTVSPEQRSNVRALLDRIVAALRRALGLSERVSDAEIFQLIEDAGRYADRGIVRGTSVRSEAAEAVGRPIASRVGTRNPTAVKATERGVDPGTVVGYDSFKADRKAFEKNVQLLTQYPGIRKVRGKATPERIAEAFVMHSVDNLVALHDAMPAQLRSRAKQWYVGANRAANYLADKYGITDVQAAASIAALSPQKDWFQNLSLAERVIDAHVNQNERAWDAGMSATLAEIFGKEQYADLRAAIEGKPLSALADPVERAAWIRTYDQTHNDSAFPITSPEGEFVSTSMTGAGNPARIQWGSLAEAAKAIAVLQDGSLENVSDVLGRMHKIRSFYNNIIDPNSAAGDVTIDTHAVAAALIRPLSAASVEVGHNFGTGTGNSSVTGNSGMYGLYAEAYRRAAAERGLLPREMQSITWEAVRALYPAPTRRPNSRVLRDVNENWGRYGRREINHGEAVENAIDAGGGIREPDWAGSAARVDEGEWAGAFRPAVAGAGVSRGGAGSSAAGDGDSRGAGPVASRRPLDPLPGAPRVRGATGPDPRLVEVADAYARENGIELRRQSEYVKADPERGARIAQAYEAMEHAPNDPVVREAYENLIRQTTAQYRALEEAGYRFWFTDPDNDPYDGNPWNAMRDLRANQSMGVFPTDAGFGSGATDIDVSDNPLMADTGIRWPFGSPDGELRPVLANDLFRAVHDAFGHGLEGAGFRADGEENAWQAHVRLFTGSAVGAITTETRGQNSWLNFGPHGERNRTAGVEDTVFADQKTGLLPEWVWSEGRADDESYVVASRAARSPATRVQDAIRMAQSRGDADAELLLRRYDRYRDRSTFEFDERAMDRAMGRRGFIERTADDDGRRIDIMTERDVYGMLSSLPDEPAFSRATRGFSAKKRQPDAVSVDAYHYSTTPGLTELDPSFAGTAGAGRERRRFGMGRFGQRGGTAARLGFYVREPGAPVPAAEDVVAGAGGRSLYRVQLDNLYDLRTDPRGFAEEAGMNQDMLEEEIADAGFDGFVAGAQPGIDTPVAVVFDIGRKKIPVEEVSEGAAFSRAPQTDTPEFRRWFGNSKVVDGQGNPRVVYRGEHGADTSTELHTRMSGITFSEDPDVASIYAEEPNADDFAEAPRVTAAYLRIENPIIHNEMDPFLELSDLQEKLGRDEAIRIARKFSDRIEYTGNWDENFQEFGSVDALLDSFPDRVSELYFDAYHFLDDDAEVAKLRAAGFDGAIHIGNGESGDSLEYRVFDRSQVKSATGNSGEFDPSNPSIIASRATPADAYRKRGQLFGRLGAAGYRQGSVTQPQNRTGGRFVGLKNARDGAIAALQDKMMPLRRAQQRVSADGPAVSSITLDDAMNAYRLENLMHGAVNDELKRIDQTHIKAIQDGIRKSSFTVEQFEDYLYAKAAPERNREIAKINRGMPDAGSGITTKMAGDILAGRADGVFSGERLTPEAIKLFDQLNKHVRALRDLALDNMVSAGQITPQLVADLKAKYPNYVPMRGKDAELDEGRGSGSSGRGISQRAANIRRALGRGADNIPVNILGELVGDAQRSVVAKGKAKVARAFLRFALANPQPDLYTVEPVDLEWKFSEATGEAYLGVKRRGEDINETMLVMHDGKPVYIRITDPALRDAVLNMGVEDMGKALRVFSALNRWRSAVLTRFNPAFTPINMARDLQFGTVAIAAEHGAGVAARTIAAYPSAMRAAYRHEAGRRGNANKPVGQRTMADWAAEAYANGMSTGVTHVPNVVDLQRDLVESTVGVMKLAASGRPLASIKQAWLRTAGPLIEAIENANGATENAIRLAVYTTLRKDGWSIDRAAEYAKNVTINFNRKGRAGSILNAIFLFYNAAVQGTVAVARVMRKPQVVAYLGGLAALQGVLAAGMMDDEDDDGVTEWDKIPDYVKRTSLVIPLGEDHYFALPMPYGFNWFTYLGGRGTQRMMLGDRPTDKSVFVDLVKSLSEAFAPIPLHDGYRSLFGDQVGFAMGLASNTDDFGSPIAKSDAYSDYPVPRALEGKVTTPQVYHWAAQMLAKAGGADLAERKAPVGWLDVAPEHIEELVDYLGGGITSLINKGMRSAEQLHAGNVDDAMALLSAAPISSRLFVEGKDARAIADRYYGERGEFARHRDIVNARLEKGVPLDEAIADRPQEYVAGMRQETYARSGRTKDGRRYRRGQPRVDASGKPVIGQDEVAPAGVLKDVEKRNKALGKAITQIREGKLTNAEIAEMYDGHYRTYMATVGQPGGIDATGKPTDIGLPDGFDASARAPARVRNRAIKLLQDMRAQEQRRLLRSLEYRRRATMTDDDEAELRDRLRGGLAGGEE